MSIKNFSDILASEMLTKLASKEHRAIFGSQDASFSKDKWCSECNCHKDECKCGDMSYAHDGDGDGESFDEEGVAFEADGKHDPEAGDEIRVTKGNFANFKGKIEEINKDEKKAKVILSIFGRKIPMELAFEQFEKYEPASGNYIREHRPTPQKQDPEIIAAYKRQVEKLYEKLYEQIIKKIIKRRGGLSGMQIPDKTSCIEDLDQAIREQGNVFDESYYIAMGFVPDEYDDNCLEVVSRVEQEMTPQYLDSMDKEANGFWGAVHVDFKISPPDDGSEDSLEEDENYALDAAASKLISASEALDAAGFSKSAMDTLHLAKLVIAAKKKKMKEKSSKEKTSDKSSKKTAPKDTKKSTKPMKSFVAKKKEVPAKKMEKANSSKSSKEKSSAKKSDSSKSSK